MRLICPVVVLVASVIAMVVIIVAAISSQRVPVKLGGQTQTKPPTDVSEHVPPLKQGRIAHGLGGAVIRKAKEKDQG